jgi:hypothetical protein
MTIDEVTAVELASGVVSVTGGFVTVVGAAVVGGFVVGVAVAVVGGLVVGAAVVGGFVAVVGGLVTAAVVKVDCVVTFPHPQGIKQVKISKLFVYWI